MIRQMYVLAIGGVSSFQMISTLVGSGLVIFLLNNLTADINQPEINLSSVTNEIKNNLSSTHSSNNTKAIISNTNAKFDTIAINNGRSSATNLILRLYYPNGIITNFSSDIQSENVIFNKPSPNLLIADTKRLSKDSIISITTDVACNAHFKVKGVSTIGNNIGLGNISNLKCPPVNYFITVSYDQGSSFTTNIDSSFINIHKLNSFHSKDRILTIIITIAIIAFISALLHRRINRLKKRLSKPKFVFEIFKEIIIIRDIIKGNINSKKIFPIDTWFSKDAEDKLKIFNDYGDYYCLDDFYSKLKERDDVMSNKNQLNARQSNSFPGENDHNQDYKTLEKSEDIQNNKNKDKEINEQCLILANNAIKNINWKDYQDTRDKKYYKPIEISITITCALLMSLAFEFYRLAFFHFTVDIPLFSYMITYDIFTGILRAFIFFILTKEIINFTTLFAYEVGTKNNALTFFTFDRDSQTKLLILSFILGGIPIMSLLTNFDYISEEINLFAMGSSTGYIYFMLGFLTDTALFLILVYTMRALISKKKFNIDLT